jgi:hypothetical protein
MSVVYAFRHLTKRGTRVIIAHDDVRPARITNPHLFKPKAASGSTKFPTVAGKSIGTAAATQGSPVSSAETPEATGNPPPCRRSSGYAPAFSRLS